MVGKGETRSVTRYMSRCNMNKQRPKAHNKYRVQPGVPGSSPNQKRLAARTKTGKSTSRTATEALRALFNYFADGNSPRECSILPLDRRRAESGAGWSKTRTLIDATKIISVAPFGYSAVDPSAWRILIRGRWMCSPKFEIQTTQRLIDAAPVGVAYQLVDNTINGRAAKEASMPASCEMFQSGKVNGSLPSVFHCALKNCPPKNSEFRYAAEEYSVHPSTTAVIEAGKLSWVRRSTGFNLRLHSGRLAVLVFGIRGRREGVFEGVWMATREILRAVA
ncbi:hypothetical protein B0H16DRAFT_1469805 [Mycena metata]|uniref:Uncharacterized protein n=1 Tax=Mycena metata TaxID=1033252 RepID=A0AAD7HWW7_9AGAR|nr:hypothetical protein B0H16DRAFT_1469805 [Mycena metata]